MKTAEEILSMVNEFLANLPYERKPMSLYEPIRYVLSMGGKRIRPTLMLLGYNLFKDNPEKILMNAVALETYHNYTLLHDDLMDNADLRRGHETVHKKWDANTAILSGDSMLVLSYERMAQCDEKHLAKVLKLFTTTALEIGEGADDNHAAPSQRPRRASLSPNPSSAIQARVRFLAYHRIKPHVPPLVRAPVNSFEFHRCRRTPQVDYLLC